MSDQTGKTEEDVMAELRLQAIAAVEGNPLPQVAEAPEGNVSETADEAVVKEQKAEAPEASKGQPDSSPAPEEQIPEKYKGKSESDLRKILQDQDSYIGKLGSERTHEKSEAEKLRQEFNSFKADAAEKKEQDREETFKQELQDDPAKALIDYTDNLRKDLDGKLEQERAERQDKEAQAFYNTLLENPDFVRRQSHVDKVAGALRQYVKPEYLKSTGFIEISDLVSKGLDVDYYVQQSKTELASKKEAETQEKRDAQTLSGSSSGQTSKEDPKEMTMDELKARAMAAFSTQK
jgi:hypothetical protein